MTKHRTTAFGLTAGLIGGAAAGLLLGVPALTSASSTAPAVVQQTDDDTGTTDTTDVTGTEDTTDEARPDRAAVLRDSLQALVDDSTITAEQADAVAAHLDEQLPERGGRGGPGHGHHGGPGFDGEVVADLLGIDVTELRDALRSGSSIADLAEANGVDVQTIIDALVAEADSHLDLSVENGRLTQEEADAKLADITERITEMVERSRPVGD